jgi:hypothetical protein
MSLMRDVKTILGVVGDVNRKVEMLARRTAPSMDNRDVQAIFTSLFEAHVKLDDILLYCYGEDDGEEEEPDHG